MMNGVHENKRVCIYSRVSTADQNTDNQTDLLKEIVEQNGWNLIDTYVDEGISGSKGRDKRPEFDRLCKDMVRRRFDQIMVWDVSRLGRSLQHLIEFLNDVQSTRCDLYIHQQGLDTSTPTGRMIFQMVGVFAEFERAMISERIKLGIDRARRVGRYIGRPSVITLERRYKAFQLLNNGSSITEIASQLNISRSSVYRLITHERSSE